MLLLQNLALVAQSMGLGGWIHAAFEPTILLGGYPDIGPGLGFRFEKAEEAFPCRGRTRLPSPNPVGLDGVLQSYAPPYFKDTDAAIDAILAEKYGPSGLYSDGATAAPGMKPDVAAAFAREAPHVEPEVVEVVRAICRYIWKTYGRFPAHCHAIDSAGMWMQCHHIDPEFYTASSRRRTRRRRPRMRTRGTAEGRLGVRPRSDLPGSDPALTPRGQTPLWPLGVRPRSDPPGSDPALAPRGQTPLRPPGVRSPLRPPGVRPRSGTPGSDPALTPGCRLSLRISDLSQQE